MSRPLITDLAPAAELPSLFPPAEESAADGIPSALRRREPPALPCLDEGTLLAHIAALASDASESSPGSPLAARAESLPGLLCLHPDQPDLTAQGLLEVIHTAARFLSALTGLDRFTLQPATRDGAERAALQVAVASFAREQPERTEVVAPVDSSALAAAQALGLPARGVERLAEDDLDLDSLLSVVGQQTALVVADWLTPQGHFERQLAAAGEVAHAHGALFGVDGRGLGALAGRTGLRQAGADLTWLPLSELCPSAASAALGVRTTLTEFLPRPLVGKTRGGYELDDDLPRSIGRLARMPGNALDALEMYLRVAALGEEGLRAAGERRAAEANRLAQPPAVQYPTHDRPVLRLP
jgi:glycine dehydrogenase subunit 2